MIAALADATIVVEAGWRSGSLNTAGHAAALARPLGAVPGPITSATSAGSHRLIREYTAVCITSGDDARELIGRGRGVSTTPSAEGDARPDTDDSSRVRDALSGRVWRTSTDLAQRSGMARDEVESALGLLLLDGHVARGTQGWRRATRGR
ncbi:DNA-processing protein DprA [Microbacterium lacus]|uniref:DNA-processing protein DprA n=1 Tax=Microbacterium lacus TaxID=415217 RepID=UPI00384BCD39